MKNNPLLQLLRQNARAEADAPPPVRLEVTGDTAHVYVYEVIDQWWGASASALIEAFAAADGKDVTLHINSPGGDVFEATAMASAITAYSGTVTAVIDGMAASAATRLALAARHVRMADSGLFMIHRSWTMAWGNEQDLSTTAALLRKVDGTIAADYTRKTGKAADQVKTWMDAETWFTAQEAADAGFVDEVFVASQAAEGAAPAASARWNLSAYANAPKVQPPAQPPKDDNNLAELAARQQRLNRSRLALLQHRI